METPSTAKTGEEWRGAVHVHAASKFPDSRFSCSGTLWMSHWNELSSPSFNTIISYIDDQFERYLHDESGLNRRHIVDNRVHCCFYFISPLGHGWVLPRKTCPSVAAPSIHRRLSLSQYVCVSCATSLKPLDVQFMKAIHNKVNVVPVIAKADTLTLKERERLKRRVRATVRYCLGTFCSSWTERLLSRTHGLHSNIHCANQKLLKSLKLLFNCHFSNETNWDNWFLTFIAFFSPRFWMRSMSTESRFTTFLTPSLMRTKTSKSRLESWRFLFMSFFLFFFKPL